MTAINCFNHLFDLHQHQVFMVGFIRKEYIFVWICSSDSVSIQRDILNFLREGELPHRDRVRAVHREAQYYAIGPLLDSLEDTQPLTGEKVRQAFLDLLPYYKGKCSPPPSHDVMNTYIYISILNICALTHFQMHTPFLSLKKIFVFLQLHQLLKVISGCHAIAPSYYC